jgi:TolB-like protein/class 3 adenylate cyclase
VPTESPSPVSQTDLEPEIAHLLLIDIVGYSKLLVNEQIEAVQELNRVVRGTECFRKAEADGKLLRVPTGDGMILLFSNSPEQPIRCALEIAEQLKERPQVQVRMGIHSGPANQVRDVNDEVNVAGAGINVAQRVMDCGDAGHILLSKHVADDLVQYRNWQPYLHDLGECEVKHGLRLHVVNLVKDGVGNLAVPEKLRRGKLWKRRVPMVRPIHPKRVARPALIAALSLGALAIAATLGISLKSLVHQPSASKSLQLIAEKSVAVLPFENLSDDKQNIYFSDGVQDEILNDLCRVADLKVISRTSVMQYRNSSDRNLREIAKALGVAHIVEGTVQRAGGRVRVSAQLIDARTDQHLWGEHFDRDLADVFALESELAEKIVDRLKATLSPEEKSAIDKRPTSDLQAFELYERAKALWSDVSDVTHAGEKLPKAAQLLEEAVAGDPEFLQAWCLLSRTHGAIYRLQDHTQSRLDQAKAAVDRALHIQPSAGEAHLALAIYYYFGFLDYRRAREELALARRTLPNDAEVFLYSGLMSRREGRWEEAPLSGGETNIGSHFEHCARRSDNSRSSSVD